MGHHDISKEVSKIAQIAEILSPFASDFDISNSTLIGDDAAIVGSPRLDLFASDMMVENVHFSRSYFTDAEIGYRSISTNVSDFAAMGGMPRYATIALGCPEGFQVNEFYTGVRAACDEYDLRIAGGDLSSSSILVAAVAVVGFSFNEPIRRSTASVGEFVFTTGPFGGSAAGLALLKVSPKSEGRLQQLHKHPRARLHEGRTLSVIGASAAIDVSDGMILDLSHVCSQSRLGAQLDYIPITEGASLSQAMYGGEDYQLIFCHRDPEIVASSFEASGLMPPTLMGRLVATPGITYKNNAVMIDGYQHRF